MKPLPQVSQQGENNTIIETGETKIKLVEILEIIFYFHHRTTIRIIENLNVKTLVDDDRLTEPLSTLLELEGLTLKLQIMD